VGKAGADQKRRCPNGLNSAIDRAAMKIGADDSDAYLAEWRKGRLPLLRSTAIRRRGRGRRSCVFRTNNDANRIKTLIANDGGPDRLFAAWQKWIPHGKNASCPFELRRPKKAPAY